MFKLILNRHVSSRFATYNKIDDNDIRLNNKAIINENRSDNYFIEPVITNFI